MHGNLGEGLEGSEDEGEEGPGEVREEWGPRARPKAAKGASAGREEDTSVGEAHGGRETISVNGRMEEEF